MALFDFGGASDFFEGALDFGTDLFEGVSGFVSDIGLDDVATLATAGAALGQLFQEPQVPGEALGAAEATKIGAQITTDTDTSASVSLGGDTEDETAAEEATRNRLRVRRTDPGLSITGGAINPLAIQI